jgi:phospholipase C
LVHCKTHTPHDSATYVSPSHNPFGRTDLKVHVDSDASFQRQLAGHVETGKPSVSDPAIGAALPQTADVS